VSIVLPIQLLTALEVNVAVQSLKATLALKATFLKKYFRVFAHLPVVAEATPPSTQWDPWTEIQTMLCPNMGVECYPHE